MVFILYFYDLYWDTVHNPPHDLTRWVLHVHLKRKYFLSLLGVAFCKCQLVQIVDSVIHIFSSFTVTVGHYQLMPSYLQNHLEIRSNYFLSNKKMAHRNLWRLRCGLREEQNQQKCEHPIYVTSSGFLEILQISISQLNTESYYVQSAFWIDLKMLSSWWVCPSLMPFHFQWSDVQANNCVSKGDPLPQSGLDLLHNAKTMSWFSYQSQSLYS